MARPYVSGVQKTLACFQGVKILDSRTRRLDALQQSEGSQGVIEIAVVPKRPLETPKGTQDAPNQRTFRKASENLLEKYF